MYVGKEASGQRKIIGQRGRMLGKLRGRRVGGGARRGEA